MLYNFSDTHINKNLFKSKRWWFTRQNLINVLDMIVEHIKETKEKWNVISIAWDLFHDRIKDFRQWELWLAETLVKYSKEISEIDDEFEFILIPWNHDAWNVLWENTTLTWFNNYDSRRIRVIDNELTNVEKKDFNLIFAPFPFLHKFRKRWEYKEKLKKFIESIDNWKKKILISHFIITWTNASNHWWFTSRNIFSTNEELESLWLDMILLWDNHSPYDEWMISSIWSIEQTTFNEEWEEKSILVINSDLKRQRVILNNQTMLTYDIDCSNNEMTINELEDFIKKEESILNKKCENKNLRLRISLKQDDSESANRIKIISDWLWKLKEKTLSYKEHFKFTDEKSEVVFDDNFLDDFWNEEKLLKSTLEKKHWKLSEKEFIRYLEKSKWLMKVDKVLDKTIEEILTNNK